MPAPKAENRVAIPLDLPGGLRFPPDGLQVEASGRAMGVDWTLKATSPPDLPVEALTRAVQASLDAVVAQMSTWEPDADVSRFNAAPAGTWRAAPEDFAEVLACALDMAQLSDGAFDPTIGRLTDLWGFGPPGPVAGPPAAAALEAARAVSGWRRLEFDVKARRIRQPGGLALDFSGIAKGYGVDAAAEALGRLGLAHFLLEVGGELRGEGVKPDGSPWWVALEHLPGEAANQAPIVVALCGASVATSGDYRRYMLHEGQRLAHTIDPRTGRPSESGVACASVVHPQCMRADAWCTLLSVLEPEEGLALCHARQIAARLLVRTKRGLEERLSPAFQALLEEP